MGTKLQNLASFWQEFALNSVQKNLDEVATEITTRQDESDASKKLLIDLLRDFKKSNGDDVKLAVAPVVKSFQNEVDSLAKRAKAAEKAFFDVYKSLADMPDPTPILEQAIERNQQLASKIQDYEIETKQLRETMQDQGKEITELKVKEKKMVELQNMVNQYDKNIDETLNQRLGAAVEKVQVDFDEKLKVIDEEKADLVKKAQDAEAEAKATQVLLEQTHSELYDASSKLTQKSDAKSEEVDMLLSDLEVANQRAVLAEKESEQLREKLRTAISSQRDSSNSEDDARLDLSNNQLVNDLKRDLSAKEREVAHMVSEVSKLSSSLNDLQQSSSAKIHEIESQNRTLSERLITLEEELAGKTDYDSLKKDLGILKSLEFGDDDHDPDNKPLEVMILERSKTLQTENTSLRMEKERLAEELGTATKSLTEKTVENERQSQLISELEDHVEKLQDLTNVNRGEAEGRCSSTDILTDLDIGNVSTLSKGRDSPLSMTSSSILEKGGVGGDSSSLLPIIQAQRERYKKRNDELEVQHSNQLQQISVLQCEVKDLQADNVKLYEKIRFLQGYQVGNEVKAVENDFLRN